jgi:hypothetical protein
MRDIIYNGFVENIYGTTIFIPSNFIIFGIINKSLPDGDDPQRINGHLLGV